MNAHRLIALGLAMPAASLAVMGCGAAHRLTPPASSTTSILVAEASGSGAGPAYVSSSARASKRRAPNASQIQVGKHGVAAHTTPGQQKKFYQEGANPKVATPTTRHPTARHRYRSSHLSSQKLAQPSRGRTPTPKQPNLGTYVGPPSNGANRCGYVALGPGMEQAEAFVLRSVGCATARRVAVASSGHTNGRLKYEALGFSCVGSTSSRHALLRYECSAGGQAFSFQLT